ncbi:MAG: TolC family protein [Desulfobulbaceae bacterium]|nr:TolC family protein [Desulfobulbaceae bacterium]
MKTTRQQPDIRTQPAKTRLLLCLAMVFTLGTAPTAMAGENSSLEELVRIGLEQNSEIIAARSRLSEATEKIRQAGVLPDPRLGVEYFLQPVETRTGPQEASISLNQSIPWPARLSLDKQLKKHDADITGTFLTTIQLGVISRIKEAYIEYGYLGQAHKITGQILELMNYLEGIARTNYSSGKASYTDVLKIQIEIAKLENKQQSLDDNTMPVRVRINSLLGVDRNLARRQPETLPEIVLGPREEEIFTLARQYSPKILAGRYKINRSRTGLDIADQGFYPDFNVSVKTIFTGDAEFGDPPDSGRNPVIAGLSVNLPLFYDRRNSAIAEKQASIGTARSELEQTLNSLDTDIELTLFRYREAERQLNLYRDNLLPKVHQELEVALEAFQSGEYSILELIDAEKNWLNFELARIRAQADMAIQVARLEELAGTTLTDWDRNS